MVFDVSWQPGFVRSAVEALGPTSRHWTYVSSCSVYADQSVGAGEDAELAKPLESDEADHDVYAEAKAACEEGIDVRDLARWLVVEAETGVSGVFNVVGEQTPFAAICTLSAEVARYSGEIVTAPPQWLRERGVEEWMGPPIVAALPAVVVALRRQLEDLRHENGLVTGQREAGDPDGPCRCGCRRVTTAWGCRTTPARCRTGSSGGH